MPLAGKERRSYDAYGRARQSLERLRNGIHGDELKIAFMKDRAQIYEPLVAHCVKCKHQSRATIEAFKYIEEAKSRSLLDVLSSFSIRIPACTAISDRSTPPEPANSERN